MILGAHTNRRDNVSANVEGVWGWWQSADQFFSPLPLGEGQGEGLLNV